MEIKDSIRIVPLGGFGEIGRNMFVFENDNRFVVIDAGISFPEEEHPGIDLVLPDFSYLVENREKVEGIILTHAHEDHIGALPYLLREVSAPVYGSKLTLGFAGSRIEEFGLSDSTKLIEIKPRDKLSIAGMEFEFFSVSHSVVDSLGICLKTGFGRIVHTSDFKFDYGDSAGNAIDFYKLASYGEEGVILLLSDSTNADVKGFTPSESNLLDHFRRVISKSKGRIYVGTFSSNVVRIQHILDICSEAGKKVVVLGRSMEKNIEIAARLGYLSFNPSLIVSPEIGRDLRPSDVVVLTTGTQGEPMSALWRIVNGKYRGFQINKGDTVILSASIIPGNEKTVTNIINSIFRQGAEVYYEGSEDIHVSGHGSSEELKLMISITRPRYLLPLHGEYKHLIAYKKLASEMGYPEDRVIIVENGDIITVNEDGVKKTDRIELKNIYVDGSFIGKIETKTLIERNRLSETGIFVIVMPVSIEENSVLYPEVFARGVIGTDQDEELIEKAREMVFNEMKAYLSHVDKNWDTFRDEIKKKLKTFFSQQTVSPPLIVPIVIES